MCDTYEPPMEEKLDALFALSDIGDDRPKKFRKELQRLAADASREDMLKRIFVPCLPQRVVTAITGSLGGSLDEIINAADRAWTATAKSATSAITVLAVTGKRGGRPGQRGNRTSNQLMRQTVCHFYKRFGDSARKCAPGCYRWNEECQRESRVFYVEESFDGEDAQEDTASGNV